MVKAASDNWLAYNEALLTFYLGNTERCLLVHGQQVRAKTADCLRQVQHQMGVVLHMPFDGLAAEVKQTGWNALQVELCARVISANPKVGQMYTDLQSVASLPMGNAMDKPSFDTDMAVLSKFVALHRSNLKIQQVVEELKAAKEAQEQALNQQLATLVQSFEKAHAYGHDMAQEKQNLLALAEDRLRNIEELRQREGELQGRVNELAGQLQQARDEVNQHAAVAAADYVTSNKALEEENQMLLEELFRIQEDLEQKYIDSQQIDERLESAETINRSQLIGASDYIKNGQTYQLGAVLVKCDRSIKGYLSLPIKIIAIIRKSNNNKNNYSLENYIDSHQAEIAKRHLSYKLGEVLSKALNNPFRWLILPLEIMIIYGKWKKEKVEMELQYGK